MPHYEVWNATRGHKACAIDFSTKEEAVAWTQRKAQQRWDAFLVKHGMTPDQYEIKEMPNAS